MDDEEICDQLVTMLLAGHETTAITLANASAVLCKLALHVAAQAASTQQIITV